MSGGGGADADSGRTGSAAFEYFNSSSSAARSRQASLSVVTESAKCKFIASHARLSHLSHLHV
jgi:hypothetical protein